MPSCSALNCSNTTKDEVRLFRVPRDPARRKIWVINSGRDKWKITDNSCFCEKHFEESQFESHRLDGLRKLKPFANPTIFDVPNPPAFVTVKRKNPCLKRKCNVERAFQKQPTVFLNKKKTVLSGKASKTPCHVKSVGLGFKTPREAIDGHYIDKKCPFTGNVSIRGRILSGVVLKMKMQRTIVIHRDYLHYVRKYERFEKRHKNLPVHLSPCFRDVSVGDIVTVGECRPLSKTVRFNVIKVSKGTGSKKSFQKF